MSIRTRCARWSQAAAATAAAAAAVSLLLPSGSANGEPIAPSGDSMVNTSPTSTTEPPTTWSVPTSMGDVTPTSAAPTIPAGPNTTAAAPVAEATSPAPATTAAAPVAAATSPAPVTSATGLVTTPAPTTPPPTPTAPTTAPLSPSSIRVTYVWFAMQASTTSTLQLQIEGCEGGSTLVVTLPSRMGLAPVTITFKCMDLSVGTQRSPYLDLPGRPDHWDVEGAQYTQNGRRVRVLPSVIEADPADPQLDAPTADELAFTGTDTAALAGAGIALLAAGVAAVRLTRSRRA